jgi:hypothetical protein
MTARDLATVLFKVLGLVWVYSGVIRFLEILLDQPRVPGTEMFSIGLGLSLGLTVSAGVVLLVAGKQMSALLVPESGALSIAATPDDLFTVLAGILGLFFVVSGLTSLIGHGYMALNQPEWSEQPGYEEIWETQRFQLVTAAVQLLLGGFLVLGRRGLTAVWGRLHPMGSPEASVQSDGHQQ